jgi:hypothetical protein
MSTLASEPIGFNSNLAPGGRPYRRVTVDAPPPAVVMLIGEEQIAFDAATIANPDAVASITRACEVAPAVRVDLEAFVPLPEPFRTDSLRFLHGLVAALPGRLTFFDPASHNHQSSLLAGALALLCSHHDPDRCHRVVQLAVTAAAIEHPEALPAACSSIHDRLRYFHVQGYATQALLRTANEIVRRGYAAAPQRVMPENVLLRCALNDSEIEDDLLVPNGWRVDAKGIAKLGSNSPQPVTFAPIIIRRRLLDVDGGEHSLEIAWRREDQWSAHITRRANVADRHRIVELAQFGAPVNSNNAAACVDYLTDFEAANIGALKVDFVARSMGWQDVDNDLVFLCGRTAIRCGSGTGELLPFPSSETEHVIFQGRDVGDEQIIDAFHHSGSFEGWRQAVMPLQDFPRAMLSVYAALAAPLLFVLRAAHFLS